MSAVPWQAGHGHHVDQTIAHLLKGPPATRIIVANFHSEDDIGALIKGEASEQADRPRAPALPPLRRRS